MSIHSDCKQKHFKYNPLILTYLLFLDIVRILIFSIYQSKMNSNSYEEMYEEPDIQSNGRLKPHAQVHLLSPTDKCKVK